jgi:hypothetical protein
MAWVVTVIDDPDKTNVGMAMAVFTDTDSTVFSFSRRDIMTNAAATQFASDAVAARDAWKTRKTNQTSQSTTLAGKFTALGETATAGPST